MPCQMRILSNIIRHKFTGSMIVCQVVLAAAFAFSGCSTAGHPSKSEMADSISERQDDIRRYFMEIDVLERSTSRLTSNMPVPDYIQNNANIARNSPLSDQAYFRALNDFDEVVAQREHGLNAEVGVYARWHFGDFGLSTTNKNNSESNNGTSANLP